MTEYKNRNGQSPAGAAYEGTWPGIDSRFRLIIVASLRNKQLVQGSKPRIEVDKMRRRNTSIALEEVKRGLVAFTNGAKTPSDRISKDQETA
ncbi:MAG TPA: DNA-directed RNA polymerase subunit omega [Pyrinomonadaceae bacterium]